MRDASNVSWGVARRYEFIEWRAYWDGRLNRGDLEREFNISTPQASVDLRNYQEAAPENIEYNSSEKAYVATSRFHPLFLNLSAERYLRQLHSLKINVASIEDTWFDVLPAIEVLPTIARSVEAYTLRALLRAIRMNGSIKINYRSLTSARNRVICPHSLANDGYRWHVRAYCMERKEYRDFVLGRILSVFPPEAREIVPPEDVEWESFTKLILVPNPGLSGDQQETIARDYKIENGELHVAMRVSLSYYFVRRYNLDLRNGELPAERAPLFLKNYDEVLADSEAAKAQAQAMKLAADQGPGGVGLG
ncbi:WYL domain-containing protein [Sphingopyxis terrae]|uniref:WYL domain-containing protein n=1 Tax=Sphingopyxis terrae TaxID=33052 RepID=UPI001C2C7BDC|nr:WYL domain-containing protein [Sphingopyxis terrae]QXF11101.1 WYL domain-containing protein [Sphingopyxis terrae subsp. terrae]